MSECWISALKLCFAVLLVAMSVKAMDQCEPGSDLVCCGMCLSTDADCNGTCPNGFTAINQTSACFRNKASGNVSIGSGDNYNTSLCMRDCTSGVYYDNDNIARCCDSACWNCKAAGRSNCDVCKIYHNSMCVDDCPDGFKKVVNKTADGGGSPGSHEVYVCQKIHVPTDDDKTTLIIIIASGGGGGVLLIIVVVVICCCCCRLKNGQKRRPISLLAEKKSQQRPNEEEEESGPKPPVGSRPPTRRHAYENTALQPSDLGQKVQQQHDVVGRYTRDPTLNVNKNRKVHGRQDADSDYSNSAMVNLHRRIDTSVMSREEIDQQLEETELAELGLAPTAPQSVKLRKKQSTRTAKVVDPLVKQMRRISQKFSSKRRQGKVEEPVDYLDMSGINAAPPPGDMIQQTEDYESTTLGATASTKKQMKALPMLPSKPTPHKTSSKPSRPYVNAPAMESHAELADMEAYENTMFGDADDSAKLKKNGTGTRKKGSGREVPADCDNDMEDYENVTGNTFKRGERTERNNTDDSDGEDQEDYENMKEVASSGSARKPADTGEEDLDDYENVNKKLGGVQESAEAEDEEELQDYENSGQFRKLGESLELYENFESIKGKK